MRRSILVVALLLFPLSVLPNAGAEQTKFIERHYVAGHTWPEFCEVEGTSTFGCLDVRGSTSMDVEIEDISGQAIGGMVAIKRELHEDYTTTYRTFFCGSTSLIVPEGAKIAFVGPINYALNPLSYPCDQPAVPTYGVIRISY